MVELFFRELVMSLVGVVALALTARASASTRHALAACALGALLLVPFFQGVLPVRLIRVLPATTVAPPVSKEIIPTPLGRFHVGPQVVPIETRPMPWLALIWIGGIGFLSIRLGLGLVRVTTWRRSGLSLGDEIVANPDIDVPMTAWMGRHIVFVPSTWSSWSSDAQASALSHERAHIRRGDWFVQLGSQVACVFLWPNPVVWYLAARLRSLAEIAADDLAVAELSPSRYAEDLLAIAQLARKTSPLVTLPMAVRSSTSISWRIQMILNHKQNRRAARPATIALSALAFVLAAVPAATLAVGQQAAPSQVQDKSREKTPVQILLKMAIMEKNWSYHFDGQPEVKGVEKLHVESASHAYIRGSIKSSEAGHMTVATPTIRTINGMTASVTTSGPDGTEQHIEVTPRLNKDESISMTIKCHFGKVKENSVFKVRAKKGDGLMLSFQYPDLPAGVRTILIDPSVVTDNP